MDSNRNLRIVRTSGPSYPYPYKDNVLWVYHDEDNNPVTKIWDHGKWVSFTGNGSGSGDITVDTELNDNSTNPVQNKVITQKLNELDDKTKHPIIQISANKASFSSAFSESFKTQSGGGTVTNYTWDEIRKFIQNETPIRVLFDGLDVATPLEVHYQDAEDGYYSGIISTADFRREFRIDHSLSVDITDTYGLQTFMFEIGSIKKGQASITTPQDTINACIQAFNNDHRKVRVILFTDNNTIEFTSLAYTSNKTLIGTASIAMDETYTLICSILLSERDGESAVGVTKGFVDLSDYYTQEEIDTKLNGYAPVYDCSWILNKSVTDEEYNSAVTALSKGYLFQLQKGLYKIPVLVGMSGETRNDPMLYFTFQDSNVGNNVLRTIEVRKGSGLPVIYNNSIIDFRSKQDKPTIKGLTNAQTVNVAGESSKLYSGTFITTLTIAAAKTANSQNGAEEVFQFSTGAVSPTIAITGVSWANSDVPTFEANKTYEIRIMYNSTLDKFLATYATYE